MIAFGGRGTRSITYASSTWWGRVDTEEELTMQWSEVFSEPGQ